LAGRVRDPAVDRAGLHDAGPHRDALFDRRRHHLADPDGHLPDAVLGHGLVDRVGNLVNLRLAHHAGRGRGDVAANLSTFLEGATGAGLVVADALLIDVGAADLTADRVRNLLLDDLAHLTADCVGGLRADRSAFLERPAGAFLVVGNALVIDVGAADAALCRVGHLLDDRVRDLAADGVGHLLMDGFLHLPGAGDLLAPAVILPHPLAPHLARGILAAVAAIAGIAALPPAAGRTAGAGVEADFTALLDAAHLHRHVLVDPLAALVANGLVVAVVPPDLL